MQRQTVYNAIKRYKEQGTNNDRPRNENFSLQQHQRTSIRFDAAVIQINQSAI